MHKLSRAQLESHMLQRFMSWRATSHLRAARLVLRAQRGSDGPGADPGQPPVSCQGKLSPIKDAAVDSRAVDAIDPGGDML